MISSVPAYSFQGDAVTVLGLIGIASTFVILISVWRSYWTSPYRK